jgi:hypothetical protein
MKNQDSNSSNSARISRKLLREMATTIEKSETLDTLISLLETINDPDPAELYLLESLYQLKEKIKLAESRIKTLLNKNNQLLGNKLNDLYESKKGYGSSVLFD